jgi:hypothetical protein
MLQTITVNHAFLGVVVPPDTREVTVSYPPPGFRAGLALAAAATALAVGLLVWRPARRRRPGAPR